MQQIKMQIQQLIFKLKTKLKYLLYLFLLLDYYWFLWQLDLISAHYVWTYGSNDFLDGWIFEPILGHEFFRVTFFYNFCMIHLLLFPILAFIILSIREKRREKNIE